ncbi:MAG: RlmE family RNA methyltransferase [Sphingomonadaceae bacterium]
MTRAKGGSGRSGSGHVRVRTARGRSASSTRWLERQLNDPYVKRAQAEGYRARAAYKLIELDERFNLLSGARRVVDLGAAPGSWSQVVLKRQPRAQIVGIDLLPVDPLPGLTFLQADFLDDAAQDQVAEALGGKADLVLSDMAANTVGHHGTDHIRTMALVEAAAWFATEHLDAGGAFVAKVLAGGAESALVADLKRRFTSVRHAKPPASRKESSETYVVATGFRIEPA